MTRNGAVLTVSGLGSGASATVTVTVSRGGYTDASASIAGQAVRVSTPTPPPSTPVATPPAPVVDSGSVPTQTAVKPTESAPGAAAITSGGAAVDAHVTTTRHTAVVSGADDLRLTVTAQKDGKNQSLATGGVVVVDARGKLWVTVSGLSPTSIVTLWSMSRSTQLGSSRADASGKTGQLVPLPSDLTPGAHTLVAQGTDASGHPVTLQLGFRVLKAHPASAVSQSGDANWWQLVLLLAIALVVTGWFVIARRRRREQEREEESLIQPR